MSLTDIARERAFYSMVLGLSDVQADALDFAVLRASYLGFTGQIANGEETVSRVNVIGQSTALASGSVGLSFFTARETEVSTQGKLITGTTAAGATPTLAKIGVYSVAANGDLTLVASSANDTALFAAASTAYTRAWAAPFTKQAGQRYAIAQIVVSAAARPTFPCGGIGVIASELLLAPTCCGQFVGQTDLPANIPAASVTSANSWFYGVVLP